MKWKFDRTQRMATYFLLLLVAVVSCSRYPLGDGAEPPEPPEPEPDKLIWYVQVPGNDNEDGRDMTAPLETVGQALNRILEEVEKGWPENTMAEIVILNDIQSLGGAPVAEIIPEPGRPPYPKIRFRGPSIPVEGTTNRGTLRSDNENYVLYIKDNPEEVLLGAGLTLRDGKGGVYVAEAKFTIEFDATITGNVAADGSGGGVYVGSNGEVTMKGGTISLNTASSSGGGVYVATDGTFTMTGGTIQDNTAFFGGGVAVGAGGASNAKFTMIGADPIITNNTATFAGGGVYVGAGNGVIFDKKNGGNITSNSANGGLQNYGAAVALGSNNINSPNQIANFRDNSSNATTQLYAEYISSTGLWFFNTTETNWK